MMTTGKFLFVTWNGAGNVHPLVSLGTRLLRRGHHVRVLGPAELAGRFEAEDIGFCAHRTDDQWVGGKWSRKTATDGQRRAYLRGLADDVITDARREPTDVLVIDYMQPHALSAAESLGLPVAAFVHTLYQRVARAETTPMRMSGDVTAINMLRQDLGLPVVERITDLLDATARVLVVTSRELDRPEEPLASNVHYVGPLVEDAGADSGWKPPSGDGPLVHISFGTAPLRDVANPVMQRVLDALADAQLRVYATVCTDTRYTPWDGAYVGPEDFRVPPNATVSGQVRHAALLPHAQLFINQAGLSSIGAGLTFGVPMLCIPMFSEQPENAEHVAELGVGRRAAPEATVEQVRAEVDTLLADNSYRAAATRIASSIRANGSGAAAVEELECLLATAG